MRQLALAALLAVCAAPAAAQDLRVLTHAELAQAFEGRHGCRGPTSEGECESVMTLLQSDQAVLRVRELGVTRIAEFGEEPISEFVRSLGFYSAHADLFTALEAQRAAGGYVFLKQIEVASGAYDAEVGAYCSRTEAAQSLADVEFYFSSSPAPNIEGDTPLSPEDSARLRAFFVALASDAEFRSALPPDEGLGLMLDVITGGARYCVQYVGVATDAGVEVRGSLATADGVPIVSLNQPIRMAPLSEELRLVAD